MPQFKIIVMRHAEAEYKAQHLSDHARGLTPHGLQQVDKMANHIRPKAQTFNPDLVLVSDATRTMQTAQRFCDALEWRGVLRYCSSLYLAAHDEIARTVTQQIGSNRAVMIVAHNPGVSEFVGWATGEDLEMLPAQMIELCYEAGSWEEALASAGLWTIAQNIRV